jgi:hypothetical protein
MNDVIFEFDAATSPIVTVPLERMQQKFISILQISKKKNPTK